MNVFLITFSSSCDSRGIQTHNLLIRSQMLYSVELGSHPFRFAVAKVRTFYGTAKLFTTFFLVFLKKVFRKGEDRCLGSHKEVFQMACLSSYYYH